MTAPDPDRHGAALYRRLLGYLRPHRGVFALAVLAMVVTAGTEPWFAKIMKDILGEGFVRRDPAFIATIPWLIVGLFLVRGVAGFTGTYCMRWVGRRVIYRLRGQLFDHLLRLPAAYFDRHPSGHLVSKLIYDAEQVDAATTSALTTLVKDSAAVIGLLGWMIYLSPILTLTFVVVAPLLVWIVQLMSSRFRRASRSIQDSVGSIAHLAKEAVQAQRMVKIYGAYEAERIHFDRANNHNRQQSMKKATVAAASVPVIEFVGASALGGIVYFAARLTGGGGMEVATFVSYITAMLLLMGPARRLTKVNEPLQMGLAAARSVFEVLDEPVEADRGRRGLDRVRGLIEYRDVHFRYPGRRRRVLNGVSFTIEPGQTVALVGPSGAGKSTVAALLARFYAVTAGEIRLDGIPLEEIRLEALRRHIAIVPQEVVLFDDSIRNNIAYGDPGPVSGERVRRAAEAAHVLEFADRLPEGLDTRIGEHGTRLSGGQRQRIAIARALYRDAPILILDEATSSLDTESERQVRDAIERLIADRSTLVIAHRLSTIERADGIVVLDRGRVVEFGSHEALLHAGGHYARLYRNQLVTEAVS